MLPHLIPTMSFRQIVVQAATTMDWVPDKHPKSVLTVLEAICLRFGWGPGEGPLPGHRLPVSHCPLSWQREKTMLFCDP